MKYPKYCLGQKLKIINVFQRGQVFEALNCLDHPNGFMYRGYGTDYFYERDLEIYKPPIPWYRRTW